MIYKELSKPFTAEQISWRVGSTTKDKTKGLALSYIDARDVMKRLDEVVGWQRWGTKDSKQGDTYYCELSILVPVDLSPGGEITWITKTGAAGATAVEGEKGGASDAFKRAGVLFGIGRYLYDLESPWVAIEPMGRSHKIKKSEYKQLNALLEGNFEGVSREYFNQIKDKLGDCGSLEDLISTWEEYWPSRKDLPTDMQQLLLDCKDGLKEHFENL